MYAIRSYYVTKKDVLDHLARAGNLAKATTPGTEQSMGEEILPVTQTRRTIAERMVKSRQTSAHVTTFFEADFSDIAKFRQSYNFV